MRHIYGGCIEEIFQASIGVGRTHLRGKSVDAGYLVVGFTQPLLVSTLAQQRGVVMRAWALRYALHAGCKVLICGADVVAVDCVLYFMAYRH
ncbi:hypothetical protein XhyaCFBP1156_16645 [Xanthomonas hyacinthi]|uniref:Uncharacterized protein n=1 Tax=Xanthomonas hyacinthi TaxID=56455 RepID=A0A2S7ESD0_9XANT|nr:hypothetical protein XhyaCFBP1156_16645 [Xanthomonas hyacinthi]